MRELTVSTFWKFRFRDTDAYQASSTQTTAGTTIESVDIMYLRMALVAACAFAYGYGVLIPAHRILNTFFLWCCTSNAPFHGLNTLTFTITKNTNMNTNKPSVPPSQQNKLVLAGLAVIATGGVIWMMRNKQEKKGGAQQAAKGPGETVEPKSPPGRT